MRNAMMFMAGFVVMTVTGVAVAQSGLFAGTVDGSDDGRLVPLAELPEGDATSTTTAPDPEPVVEAFFGEDHEEEKGQHESSEKETQDPKTEVELAILHPSDGQHVEKGEVVFEGETTPGAKVWSGDVVADVADSGAWRMVLPLDEGKNVIYVGATIDGATVTKEVVVHRGAKLVWAITQKVKASETGFEKFYGTGSPGMTITASSAYGKNSTVIGEAGEWVLGIEFDGSKGKTFPVTVSTSTGWTKTYTFTHIGDVEEKKEHQDRDWSIHHKYPENTAAWTKFAGTGPVGTGILAQSEYGAEDVRIGENGEWYLKVWFEGLQPGQVIPVRVTNTLGFDKTYEFVWYQPNYDFWVEQKYGSCSESPPYDVFYGQTTPGSVVEIWSEYGSARREVGETGKWDAKVIFEGAPYDTPFEVHVGDSNGNQKTFTFTRLSVEGDK